jgi:hypothetical protein
MIGFISDGQPEDAGDDREASEGDVDGVRSAERVGLAPLSRIPHSALPDGLVLDFRDVPVQPDEWLPGLQGILLRGEFTMLAGDGGAGKSTTVAGWVAGLSERQVKTLYLAERSPKGTRKKLEAAGADFDYVLTFNMREFTDIRKSIGHLESAMKELGVELLVLDPVNHFLPQGTDGHKDSSFSQAIRALLDLSAHRGLSILGLHHLNKNDKADPMRRLLGGAGYVNKPAHVLGLAPYPPDRDRRALVVIKTNADDGVYSGAKLFSREQVEITISGHRFTVAKSVATGSDPHWNAEDVFRPTAAPRHDHTKTDRAQRVILEAEWVPTTGDDAQDERWYAEQLEVLEDIRLDPKNIGRLLTDLYADGINYHEAKKGPGGSKRRYWRKSETTDSLKPDADDQIRRFREDMDDWLAE